MPHYKDGTDAEVGDIVRVALLLLTVSLFAGCTGDKIGGWTSSALGNAGIQIWDARVQPIADKIGDALKSSPNRFQYPAEEPADALESQPNPESSNFDPDDVLTVHRCMLNVEGTKVQCDQPVKVKRKDWQQWWETHGGRDVYLPGKQPVYSFSFGPTQAAKSVLVDPNRPQGDTVVVPFGSVYMSQTTTQGCPCGCGGLCGGLCGCPNCTCPRTSMASGCATCNQSTGYTTYYSAPMAYSSGGGGGGGWWQRGPVRRWASGTRQGNGGWFSRGPVRRWVSGQCRSCG